MLSSNRYLTHFSTASTSNIITDVLVIGCGIAGLRAALAAAEHGQVLMLCKGELTESNTRYAQGGIAVPPGEPKAINAHVEDTLRVGCGLGNRQAVAAMIEHAQQRFTELQDWGMRFDQHNGALAYTTEGGHTQARVVHAGGDATGTALIDVLVRRARQSPAIRIFEACFAIDLLTVDGCCTGVASFHPRYGHQLIWAKQTILASGGCGRVFLETSNPPGATGDGIAMACRSGACLQDMELMQFHPTTLYVAGASRTLISEAVRGEGGTLTDEQGRPFMTQYHPQGDLAPRDVVSRSILSEMVKTQSRSVFLDVRHFKRGWFTQRFPTLTRLCARFGLDPQNDLIPVRPAAHYMIGGVSADLDGRTSLPGLWACGEAAATGVHGANRLASNSLLEGLVFGARTGHHAASTATQDATIRPANITSAIPCKDEPSVDLPDFQNSLRHRMWRGVGILRDAPRLQDTIAAGQRWSRYLLDQVFDTPLGWETQNLLTAALLIATAAAQRTESRGVHHRADFAKSDDVNWKCHLALQWTGRELRISSIPA